MRNDKIDFHAVAPQHEAMHLRLINWARYISPGRGGSLCAPMFRLYRSTDGWISHEPQMPIDALDGLKIERAVSALPEKHRDATRWSYVYSSHGMSIHKACRALAVQQDTLQRLIYDARSMLKNRC